MNIKKIFASIVSSTLLVMFFTAPSFSLEAPQSEDFSQSGENHIIESLPEESQSFDGEEKENNAPVEELSVSQIQLEGTIIYVESMGENGAETEELFLLTDDGVSIDLPGEYVEDKGNEAIVTIDLDEEITVAEEDSLENNVLVFNEENAVSNAPEVKNAIESDSFEIAEVNVYATQVESDVTTHSIDFVYSTLGNDVMDTATVNKLIQDANSFWQRETGGKIALKVNSVSTIKTSISPCNYRERWAEAAAFKGKKIADYYKPGQHLVVGNSSSCPEWGGIASVGNAGLESGGILSISQNRYLTVFVHEFGHNLSLGHSNKGYCASSKESLSDFPGGNAPIPENCTLLEYGDDYDIMGSRFFGTTVDSLPPLNAAQKERLGLTQGKITVSQKENNEATVTLNSIGSNGNKYVLISMDDGDHIYVEYRSSQGDDAKTFYGKNSSQQGVRFLRVRQTSAKPFAISYGKGTADDRVVYTKGEKFTSYDYSANDGVTVDITSTTPTSATMKIAFNKGITVTPVRPTFIKEVCGKAGEVRIPTSTGVTYSREDNGNIVTVTATPQEGYTLSGVTSWTFDTSFDACPKPAVKPTYIKPSCGKAGEVRIPTAVGVTYVREDQGRNVVVKAVADPGYTLSGTTQWTFSVAAKTCIASTKAPTLTEQPTCGAKDEIAIPEVAGISYSREDNGNTITVTATAKTGYVLAGVTTWNFTKPHSCATVPTQPTLIKPTCGVKGNVTIPNVEGVVYTREDNGNTVTVTATAKPGYTLKGTSSWKFNVAPKTCMVSTKAPTLVEQSTCGVKSEIAIPEVNGIMYSRKDQGNIVTVTATAKTGYVLAGVREWSFDLSPRQCK